MWLTGMVNKKTRYISGDPIALIPRVLDWKQREAFFAPFDSLIVLIIVTQMSTYPELAIFVLTVMTNGQIN